LISEISDIKKMRQWLPVGGCLKVFGFGGLAGPPGAENSIQRICPELTGFRHHATMLDLIADNLYQLVDITQENDLTPKLSANAQTGVFGPAGPSARSTKWSET
jgi:hypothetical protein